MINREELKRKIEKFGINCDIDSILDIITVCQEYDPNISVDDILSILDINLSTIGEFTVDSIIEDIEFQKEIEQKYPFCFDNKLLEERESKIVELAGTINFFNDFVLNKEVARTIIDMDEEQRKEWLTRLNDPKERDEFVLDYFKTMEAIQKAKDKYAKIIEGEPKR